MLLGRLSRLQMSFLLRGVGGGGGGRRVVLLLLGLDAPSLAPLAAHCCPRGTPAARGHLFAFVLVMGRRKPQSLPRSQVLTSHSTLPRGVRAPKGGHDQQNSALNISLATQPPLPEVKPEGAKPNMMTTRRTATRGWIWRKMRTPQAPCWA